MGRPAAGKASLHPGMSVANKQGVSTPDRPMPFIRFTLPNQPEGEIYSLEGARITIGRDPDNTIQLCENSVSKHHAELILVRGHYRLHDLESTNLTWVDGKPVTDFHLHEPCRIRFGNVESKFLPATPRNGDAPPAALPPTQSEIDFLKHDNRDLQSKIAALQRRIEILGEARLMPPGKELSGVPTTVHRSLIEERDALLRENTALKRHATRLKSDNNSLLRERDALRESLANTKADLTGAVN